MIFIWIMLIICWATFGLLILDHFLKKNRKEIDYKKVVVIKKYVVGNFNIDISYLGVISFSCSLISLIFIIFGCNTECYGIPFITLIISFIITAICFSDCNDGKRKHNVGFIYILIIFTIVCVVNIVVCFYLIFTTNNPIVKVTPIKSTYITECVNDTGEYCAEWVMTNTDTGDTTHVYNNSTTVIDN